MARKRTKKGLKKAKKRMIGGEPIMETMLSSFGKNACDGQCDPLGVYRNVRVHKTAVKQGAC